MNKKHIRRSALLLAALMMIGAVPTDAVTFDTLDLRSADAGASMALRNYYESNEDASMKIANALAPIIAIHAGEAENNGENSAEEGTALADGEEVLYENPRVGKVCVESSLNVRGSTSALADIVAQLYRNMEVYVIGEKKIGGHLWYKVRVEETEGYCSSAYIKYGDDAVVYYQQLHEAEKNAAALPESLQIRDDLAAAEVPEEVQKDLYDYQGQINFCLKSEYPQQMESGEYLNMYSILIYMLENYLHVRDIANEYGLTETLAACNYDIYSIELTRENLEDTTGQTEQDFTSQIAAAIEERKKDEKAALGNAIADYAASFNGILPYVWGGASLTSGADCSGFCGQIYAHFGLIDQGSANAHAYDSRAFRNVGHAVSISEIQPGDLVCYPGHVGIYYGGGMIVNEPAPGHKCRFDSLYCLPIICVRRLYD